mgnify:FL=1
MPAKLYYLGKPSDGYGWGVANTNLVAALRQRVEVELADYRERYDAPVFAPIGSHDLAPAPRPFSAPLKMGYCFTEWPLPQDAKVNAKFWDVIFCGSRWNARRLREAGIMHCEVLHQGIDFTRFTPQPPRESKAFTVFSGGKYEFRKGQDYVIAAMRHFMRHRPDVVLITAWHNPWPDSTRSMERSWLIRDHAKIFDDCDMKRIVQLPPTTNEQMVKAYSAAHVGLFPNRCEAGTNLVMMEMMACARPVIATCATGQADALDGDGPMKLTNYSLDPAGWANVNVSDILYWLERAYINRAELAQRGAQCRALVERFTWAACAEQICAAAFPAG